MKLIHCWKADGVADKSVLGGKGAGLAQMISMGLPVPPGMTIPVPVMKQYRAASDKGAFVQTIAQEVEDKLQQIEAELGHPVLVSVRSGAPVSMPGMMDTILNVGITSKTIDNFVEHMGAELTKQQLEAFVMQFHELEFGAKADGLAEALEVCMNTIPNFDDRRGQIAACARQVFDSWDSPRAVAYRKENDIPDTMGTACNVQVMVFGNLSDTSGTGVVFTRNPATGEKQLYGEFLPKAQGEELVSGAKTPLPISEMQMHSDEMSSAFNTLAGLCETLEDYYTEMMDIEFTVENGKLWLLQCRVGKRSAQASFRIACDMVGEGMIDEKQALGRLSSKDLAKALVAKIKPGYSPEATGLGASNGVAVGTVVFTADAALKIANEGGSPILVTKETSPDDFDGMRVSVGFLTANGGMTSHAAVVARAMNKPCVVGCNELQFVGYCKLNENSIAEGDTVSIDGSTGHIYLGPVEVQDSADCVYVRRVLEWATEGRRLLWEPRPGDDFAESFERLPVRDGGKIQVSTRQMESWRGVNTTALTSLLEVVKERLPNYEFVIDIRADEARYSEEDWMVANLLGKEQSTARDKEKAKVVVVKKVLGKKVKVMANDDHTGINPVTKAHTLNDLLQAKGPTMVTDECMAVLSVNHVTLDQIIEATGSKAALYSDAIDLALALEDE